MTFAKREPHPDVAEQRSIGRAHLRRLRQPRAGEAADKSTTVEFLVARKLSRILQRSAVLLGQLKFSAAQRYMNGVSHAVILRYLKRDLAPVIDRYADADYLASLTVKISHDQSSGPPKMWVCWWQGIENAPDVVRMCVSSLEKHAPPRTFTMIDSQNIQEFVSIDAQLIEAFMREDGNLAHLSDIVRMRLLAEHGGLWVDATILTLAALPDSLTSAPLTTIKGHKSDMNNRFVPDRRWAVYVIGGTGEVRIAFDFVAAALTDYWSRHSRVIDYFLADYCLALAHSRDIGGFRKAIDELPNNNPDIYRAVEFIGQPCPDARLDALGDSDTLFYKLDRRVRPPRESHGIPTVYEHLLERFGVTPLERSDSERLE